jgi:hypothetical protein
MDSRNLPNLYFVTANHAVLAKCLAVLLGKTENISVETVADAPVRTFRLRSVGLMQPGQPAERPDKLAAELLGRLDARTALMPVLNDEGYQPGFEIRSSHKGHVVLLAAYVRPAPEVKNLVRSDPRYAEGPLCA